MLCSNCSNVVKPIVALDIDGTLGDYHSHFLDFADAYLDHKPGYTSVVDYDGSNGFKNWFMSVYGVDESTWNVIKLAYRQGGMKRTMPVFDFASELVSRTRGTGAEVWLTTTRPYMRLDGIDPDTREWCRRNFISYDGLLYDEDKYSVLATRVDPARVAVVVDDLPSQVHAALRRFYDHDGAVVLRRTRYNLAAATPGGATEVNSLREAWQVIANRLREWAVDHAEDR